MAALLLLCVYVILCMRSLGDMLGIIMIWGSPEGCWYFREGSLLVAARVYFASCQAAEGDLHICYICFGQQTAAFPAGCPAGVFLHICHIAMPSRAWLLRCSAVLW